MQNEVGKIRLALGKASCMEKSLYFKCITEVGKVLKGASTKNWVGGSTLENHI
jgi:hypothetical protein